VDANHHLYQDMQYASPKKITAYLGRKRGGVWEDFAEFFVYNNIRKIFLKNIKTL